MAFRLPLFFVVKYQLHPYKERIAMEEFKTRLKQLRKEKGLSQQKLASVLGYGSTAIANYESGRNQPSIPDLITIAKELNTSTDYLIGYTDIQIPFLDNHFQQAQDLVKLYCSIPLEGEYEIFAFATYIHTKYSKKKS